MRIRGLKTGTERIISTTRGRHIKKEEKMRMSRLEVFKSILKYQFKE